MCQRTAAHSRRPARMAGCSDRRTGKELAQRPAEQQLWKISGKRNPAYLVSLPSYPHNMPFTAFVAGLGASSSASRCGFWGVCGFTVHPGVARGHRCGAEAALLPGESRLHLKRHKTMQDLHPSRKSVPLPSRLVSPPV